MLAVPLLISVLHNLRLFLGVVMRDVLSSAFEYSLLVLRVVTTPLFSRSLEPHL